MGLMGKDDKRKLNGGFRHGSGRKKGSGTKTKDASNRIIRIPNDLIEETKKQGKKLTETVISSLRNKLTIESDKAPDRFIIDEEGNKIYNPIYKAWLEFKNSKK